MTAWMRSRSPQLGQDPADVGLDSALGDQRVNGQTNVMSESSRPKVVVVAAAVPWASPRPTEWSPRRRRRDHGPSQDKVSAAVEESWRITAKWTVARH